MEQQENLRGFEKVKKIILTVDDFTVENGLATPTFKLKVCVCVCVCVMCVCVYGMCV